MSISVYINHNGGVKTIDRTPDICPFCHTAIHAIPLFGHKNDDIFEVSFHCPNYSCNRSFVGYYDWRGTYTATFRNKTSFGFGIRRAFPQALKDISPQFEVIYNQALIAEHQVLLEICGVGYRKALEFLIKDYAIKNNIEKKDHIEKLLLGQVIEKYVSDDKIKNVAKRAVWLGNDETHYIRKWEGKNLSDLKKLIDLTVHWIEMEELTKSFSEEMPDNK
jgi:hypothetical protein